MKKELNKAKKGRVAVRLISLSVATFFVATAFAITAVSAATWVGPTQQPPLGNLGGFINNTIGGGGAQTASFNVTGSGVVGTNLTVSQDATVGDTLTVTTQLCLGSDTNPANCKASWPTTDPNAGQWGLNTTWAYIYNRNATVNSGTDAIGAQEVRAHGTGKLQVYGANDWLEFQVNNTQNYSEIRWGDDIGDRLRYYFWAPSGQDREVMTLLSNGNVGIGTNSPLTKLHVQGAGTGNVLLGAWSSNNAYGSIYLNGLTTGSDYNFVSSSIDTNLYINRPSGKAIVFREANGAAAQMTIAAGGNVGVGTTNPKATLDVNGSVALESNTRGGNMQFDSWTQGANAQFGGASWRINEYFDLSVGTMVRTRTGPSASLGMQVGTPEELAGGPGGHFQFGITDYGNGGTAATQRRSMLTLRNSGQVGILTTGPKGGVWRDGTSQMQDAALTIYKGTVTYNKQDANNTVAVSRGGGAVDIYGDGTAPYAFDGIRLWDNGMKWDSDDGVNNGNGNKYWGIWHETGNALPSVDGKNDLRINQYTGTGGTHVEALTIQSVTGNVGLGGTATKPAERLEVGGNIKITGSGKGLIFPDGTKQTTAGGGGAGGWTDSGANVYLTTASDKVGIGTTAPYEELDIRGQGANNPGFIGLSGQPDGYQYSGVDLWNNGTNWTGNTLWRITHRQANASVSPIADSFQIHYKDANNVWSNPLTIVPSGNVGIGTINPGASLDVVGSSSLGATAIKGSTAGTAGVAVSGSASALGGTAISGVAPSGTAGYFSGKVDIFNGNLIVNSGNIGIGTTAPAERLAVAGNIKLTPTMTRFYGGSIWHVFNRGAASAGMYFGEDTDTGGYYIRGTGNVGIGTTAPVAKFDVNGSANIAGSLGVDIVRNACNATTYTVTCSCPAGYVILNGGGRCYGSLTPHMYESIPTSQTSWKVTCWAGENAGASLNCIKMNDNNVLN